MGGIRKGSQMGLTWRKVTDEDKVPGKALLSRNDVEPGERLVEWVPEYGCFGLSRAKHILVLVKEVRA